MINANDVAVKLKGSRKNGFQRPWHILQILSWALFPILNTHYFAFLMLLLWKILAVRVILTLFYCFMSVIIIIAAYLTCSVNPIDDQAYCTDPAKRAPGSVYCYLCEAHV